MSLKEAIKILINRAARDVAGVGVGISRPPTTYEKDREAIGAIARAWRYVYGRKMIDSEKHNLGLW